MHLVVFYVVEYLKKCIILIYKWFQYNLSLCALGSGLHAPCDLSYDIEIYLSMYLSIDKIFIKTYLLGAKAAQ